MARQCSKPFLIRWGLTMLDVGLLVFVAWYNPLGERMVDGFFQFLSRYGVSVYVEGVMATLWVWGISLGAMLIGVLLLLSSRVVHTEATGAVSSVKAQVFLTAVLLIAAALLWFRVVIAA